MKNFKYYCSNDNFLPARKLFADGNGERNDIYLLSSAMENGSFSYDLGKYNLTKDEIENNLNKYFQLDSNHSFNKIKEEDDELGFTHINYQQLYKGLPIDGAIVMFHLKNGKPNSINGSVSTIKDLETNPILSGDDAIYIAKGDDIRTKCENYTLLIDFQNGFNRLAYRVDCDDTIKYIDASTGDLFKSISKIQTATISTQKDGGDVIKDKLETTPETSGSQTPKYDINYTNTAIFGAIGGVVGYLVAKNLIKTDKVLIPMLIGAAAFAYYQIDMSKKMAGKSW
jgi:Zn-dependent metalloprotease